jgi:hypothetical protein
MIKIMNFFKKYNRAFNFTLQYRKQVVLFVLTAIFVTSCTFEGDQFYNPSPTDTGITFTNTLSPDEDINILDYLYFYNGGGVAIGDINNDQLPDIFFSGNQVPNKLYLNQGNLSFKDISAIAGVEGKSSWNTGAIMGDVNNDGYLDIYVCAVVGINGLNGYNELYINNGNNTFTESASAYGLDFDTYSSSAAFLDYDLDGDLDIYLLNHAVHTEESFGKVALRNKRNYQTGDKLLKNNNGSFVDVSEEAGIYGGVNGYGLGIAVADFNQDGAPDIYVGNDFHEDDYYYLNNGDGTFSEQLRKYFGHTSRFSMGNDVADLNHDGYPDIISLDMLPEDEFVLKSSEGDDNIQVQKMRIEDYGYHYQFTRNMLYINQPDSGFTETALLSGLAATDWSWSALFGDYDQDGEQDVFISNGIVKRPNNLDYINFLSNDQIHTKIDNTKLVDQQALDMMPSGAVSNMVFQGSKQLSFTNRSNKWIKKDTLISGATAIADLDLDGDLDIVTNNSNSPATLYINKTNNKATYLKIKFNYSSKNPFGIGTKVYSYHQGNLQYKELYTVRGFQASSEPIIHFGYGKNTKVDSLKIIWPDKTFQVLRDISTNQFLELKPKNTSPFNYTQLHPKKEKLFEKVPGNLGINFTHKEDIYLDFNRQKLIPFRVSDRGPATAIGDLNNDNKDDVFFGGSRNIPSIIFVQTDSAYVQKYIPEIAKDSIKEDVAAIINDIDGDGRNDLFIGSGGADFFDKMQPLLDNYYLNTAAGFESHTLTDNFDNAAIIKEYDFDNDGDLDVFIGNHVVSNNYGSIPNSYLLKNEAGTLLPIKNIALQKAGMITDAVWSDFNNDGIKDLIVVGEWMSPSFFLNDGNTLKKVSLTNQKLNGLWQAIIPYDIDHDGDLDYLLGNWGTNTKFKASAEKPMKMYYSDFDKNGQTETIVTTEKNGSYYPLTGLDGLASQIVSLKKKFPSYNEFAGKTIEQLFDGNSLKEATVLQVHTLQSGYLKNNKGKFEFVPFKNELQISPITAFVKHDFNKDKKDDIFVAGNYFGVKPFHGRFDSFSGALISSESDIIPAHQIGINLSQKSVRDLNIIKLNNQSYLLVSINNDTAEVYKLIK